MARKLLLCDCGGTQRFDRDGIAEATGRRRAGPLRFGAPRDDARSECHIVVDVSGGAPLFPAHHKRDGYFRADPRDPAAVADAAFRAAQMVGHLREDPSRPDRSSV